MSKLLFFDLYRGEMSQIKPAAIELLQLKQEGETKAAL